MGRVSANHELIVSLSDLHISLSLDIEVSGECPEDRTRQTGTEIVYRVCGYGQTIALWQ